MIVYLEWLFFELNTIIIALLQNEIELAAHTSFVSLTLVFYMMPKGISDCIC
jgi:hypothetical protein